MKDPDLSLSRARMADVARLAGVSLVTVSRALRTPALVAPATRARIEAAVQQVGYVPNLVASSLASRRTGIAAVIVPTLASSIFSDTLKGMADVLHASGHHMVIADSGYRADREQALVETLLGRRPEGLILTGSVHTDRTRALAAASGVPVVETWELSRAPIDCAVGFSNAAASYGMTKALIEEGYRRIAFIGSVLTGRRALQRRAGYRKCLTEHGLPPYFADAPPSHPELRSGARTLHELLERHPEVDAVVCASDPLAAGALFECQRRGWNVPDRIAIAGFGGFDISDEVVPALSTVRVPRYEIGREAANLLLARLEDRVARGTVRDLGFELVLRASTHRRGADATGGERHGRRPHLDSFGS